MLFLLVLVVLLARACVVHSGPTLSELGSEITILIHDDLQGIISLPNFKVLVLLVTQLITVNVGIKSPVGNSAVLLLSAISVRDAEPACKALGEQLWSPDQGSSSIQANLNYLTYQGQYDADQAYLISSDADGPRTITGKGKVKKLFKNSKLPVLCTQTAPFSNATLKDNSEKWHISVTSGTTLVTGYEL